LNVEIILLHCIFVVGRKKSASKEGNLDQDDLGEPENPDVLPSQKEDKISGREEHFASRFCPSELILRFFCPFSI
jgi:hypothetical protein